MGGGKIQDEVIHFSSSEPNYGELSACCIVLTSKSGLQVKTRLTERSATPSAVKRVTAEHRVGSYQRVGAALPVATGRAVPVVGGASITRMIFRECFVG